MARTSVTTINNPAETSNKGGRPKAEFTGLDGKIAKALDTYALGETITAACEGEGISRQEGISRIYKVTALLSYYYRAREMHLESRLQQLDQIVNDEPNYNKAKIKCDNIKWQAERIMRRTYGVHTSLELTVPVDPRSVPAQILALEALLGVATRVTVISPVDVAVEVGVVGTEQGAIRDSATH